MASNATDRNTSFRAPLRVTASSYHRSCSPQFAPTPRFALSQNTSKRKYDAKAVEQQLSTTPVTNTWASDRKYAFRRSFHRDRGVLEEIEDGDQSHIWMARQSADGLDGQTGDVDIAVGDAGFDATFSPQAGPSKRPRVSARNSIGADADTSSLKHGESSFGSVLSSSSEWVLEREVSDRVPATAIKSTPAPGLSRSSTSTPWIMNYVTMSTPFYTHRPRFMLHGTQQLPSAQSRAGVASATGPSPTDNRKPSFVLPRSPSPSEQVEGDLSIIPAPFSPASRTLRRRGRHSHVSSVQGHEYIPGGMASEVRSWILETNAECEHQHLKREHDSSRSELNSQRYLLSGTIRKIRHDSLGSSGLVTLAELTYEDIKDEQGSRSLVKNILLFGMPRSKTALVSEVTHIPGLQSDSLIGIHKGSAWEIELDSMADSDSSSSSSSSSEFGQARDKQKWLICIEWDIIESAG